MTPLLFGTPQGLIFLALVPLAIWWSRRLRALSSRRRRVAIFLRSAILVLLALVAAETNWVWLSRELGVIFVLDESDSIPARCREEARRFIGESLRSMDVTRDRAGLVVFGEQPSLEEKVGDLLPAESLVIRSVPGGEQTDLAAALRLAMAAFPAGIQRRIVVVSDGNETMGSAVDAARSARANGAVVDVFPLRYRHAREFKIDKLDLPARLAAGEPFDLRVIVHAETEGKASVRLFENGVPVAEARDVQFEGGNKRAVSFRITPSQAGFHTYEAHLEAEDDANPTNNRGFGFAYVKGEARVLVVTADAEADRSLLAAIRSAQFDVHLAVPESCPGTLTELQNYDAVVLSNVPAYALTTDQMKILERGVHDLGIGLVMIGGPDSFGAGGFIDTPVESALPVRMDVTQQKILPNGALAIILHTCEFPDGNYWAREISIAALNVLSSRDYMGMLDYDYTAGEQWIFPMQRVVNKPHLRRLILDTNPGDMPSFDRTMKMAIEGLANVDARVRRMVIISDGDPAKPHVSLIRQARDLGISISTVLIWPHSDRDNELMQAIAEETGGKYYHVKDPNDLPRIFVREASVVRRSLITEREFVPTQRLYTEPVTGLFGEPFPTLLGYVATTARPLAEVPLESDQKDPILAHWRYGLGRSVAFPSDAGARWAINWLAWPGYVKFWTQILRWAMRTSSDRNFQITTTIDGTRGHVVVDALTDDGRYLNLLDLRGRVTDPSFEGHPLLFTQTGPGRYEATFHAGRTGSYMISLDPPGDSGGVMTSGVSVSYSPEFATSQANESLLAELADLTGGRVLAAQDTGSVFQHNLERGMQVQPLWPWLLAFTMILIPIDIAVRRVLLSPQEIVAGVPRVWDWLRRRLRLRRTKAEEDATLSALLAVKRQVQSTMGGSGEGLPQAISDQIQAARAETPLSSASTAPPAGQPPTVSAPEPPVEDEDHTSALLRAKERARRRTRRPESDIEPSHGDTST